VFPEFPSIKSLAVTNGVVFSGHTMATGKPYPFNEDGAPVNTFKSIEYNYGIR